MALSCFEVGELLTQEGIVADTMEPNFFHSSQDVGLCSNVVCHRTDKQHK